VLEDNVLEQFRPTFEFDQATLVLRCISVIHLRLPRGQEHQRIVSLALYPQMSDQDVQDVIEAVTDIVMRDRG